MHKSSKTVPRPRKARGRIACVVLAAGLSTRFGSLKQLARMRNGKTLLQSAVDVANNSKADYVYVILGNEAEEIMKALRPERAQIVLNKNYSRGLASSIKIAIANLPGDCSAALFMVADQPFLRSQHLDKLIDAFEKRKHRVKMAGFVFSNLPRNPAIFSREMFPVLMKKLRGDRGAKALLGRDRRSAFYLKLKEGAPFKDIDLPTDLR